MQAADANGNEELMIGLRLHAVLQHNVAWPIREREVPECWHPKDRNASYIEEKM